MYGGSSLQVCLENEGMALGDGFTIINYIIEYKTQGYITDVIWRHRKASLMHEYLLFCVVLPHSEERSWIRLERMGDIAGSKIAERKRAGLLINFAPSESALRCTDDKDIAQISFKKNTSLLLLEYPILIDLAHFVVILHDEVPDYSLLHHNCWWLARTVFRLLVLEFFPSDMQKMPLLEICSLRHLEHIEAPYHSPMRGRLVRGGLLIITLSVAPIAWPFIIGGTLFIAGRSHYVLRKTENKVDSRVKRYMEKRPLSQKP